MLRLLAVILFSALLPLSAQAKDTKKVASCIFILTGEFDVLQEVRDLRAELRTYDTSVEQFAIYAHESLELIAQQIYTQFFTGEPDLLSRGTSWQSFDKINFEFNRLKTEVEEKLGVVFSFNLPEDPDFPADRDDSPVYDDPDRVDEDYPSRVPEDPDYGDIGPFAPGI
jgi:hypothetical protein